MLTIRKLESLKPRVRVRKIGIIFHEAAGGAHFEDEYLEKCLSILLSSELLGEGDREDILSFRKSGHLDDIYYRTLYLLGEAPADWDERTEDGKVDWSKRKVCDHYLFLDHLRSPYNTGSVFRSAESLGVRRIFIAPGSADPMHPRSVRTSMGTVEGVEWEWKDIGDLPPLPVFALELGGTYIEDFDFPEEGICIIGSEESGVSPEALAAADRSLGRVTIRQYGAKGSLNVSASTAILLERWMEKGGGKED